MTPCSCSGEIASFGSLAQLINDGIRFWVDLADTNFFIKDVVT